MILLGPEPKTLAESRPPYDEHADATKYGHQAAIAEANARARATGHRQIVTQSFDAATRAKYPNLRAFYRIQAVR
ncbi:hypothetical protein [Nocardioides sp.]|uniref:hypothetical protein n=1 Tax=Nocardioides sp. TaxID=35761 RepID=UPI0035ADB530